MKLSEKQVRAIISLPAQERYEHFVKQVADSEEVWGLYQDGWAIAADDEGTFVLPVWPAAEYARLCATGDWENYEPSRMELEECLKTFLPRLAGDRVLVGVFYLPRDEGVVVEPERLVDDLEEELGYYN